MKSIVVGTAGHIDHGKTALVKALTGIDADRLEEEKRRGITIDLGFAHTQLSGPSGELLRFGFVDVPGHERFVRNMLAGIGGIELVLLVIAADEGIKPQTREHFDICRLLAIQHGIAVLTKADLVDPETLEVVRLEVEDFLRGSFLEHSPIIPASALKATGLDELKRQLVGIAGQLTARNSNAITRLPIDRVFTMKGFGTVVTGTLVAGTIHKEDELQLFPAAKKLRVRGVQVHGKIAEKAVAGERTALNLAGIDKSELERGMMLSAPGLLQTSSRIDVKLSLLSSAKPLKNSARVHLHAFASETIATVALHQGKLLQPRTEAFAQLRLRAPLLLVPGDRFIIRQFSPVVTIGGGMVLDAFPIRKLKAEARNHLLKVTSAGDRKKILLARIARRSTSGISIERLVSETGWGADAIRAELAASIKDGSVARLGTRFLDSAAITGSKTSLVSALEAFHAQNPLAPGMSQETLREKFALGSDVFSAIVSMLVTEGKVEAVADLVHLRGRGVVMKDEESQSRRIIEQAFASAGLKVPALKDVLAGLKIDKTRAQKLVTLLLRDKILIRVSDDLVFHEAALNELRKSVAKQKARSPKIDVGTFKDLTGVSRKYAIPLLEYLDRERVTRRDGDQRTIL
ncbi:MAG: selenocysteine-specific translation elongation factor SelB [Acidobacteriaceae bacterium]|nr:selenocysteine-specific translation elongation factor SelB [Acidobacteriaceae bacterium]